MDDTPDGVGLPYMIDGVIDSYTFNNQIKTPTENHPSQEDMINKSFEDITEYYDNHIGSEGQYLINEIQCIFGQSDPYQMIIDGNPGRYLFKKEEFFEIFVDIPIELAEARDPKGLYKKARAGVLQNFTGIDSPYEPPVSPDLVVFPQKHSVEEIVKQIFENLKI